jgi:glycosyltransferase involved in cell wall biosynthesis
MRLLLLLPYAWDTSPSQRFRIEQWHPALKASGIALEVAALLSQEEQRTLYGTGGAAGKATMLAGTFLRRLRQLTRVGRYDAIWLHRAAFPIGPPFLERWLARTRTPIILEFDDAIYLTHTSAANERWRAFKCASKTAELCGLSRHVVVGNEYLAEYARQFNANVSIIPTTIDVDAYQPRADYPDNDPVVIGWSGSGTTAAHLRTLDSVLQRVAAQTQVRVHVMGVDDYSLEGVDSRAVRWSPAVELPELRQFDIGVMPLPDEEWARGKCALKALQYMALGIPTVTAPVGVNGKIIQDGQNGLLASTDDEWVERLVALAQDVRMRERIGRAGRETVVQEYSTNAQVPHVRRVLELVCGHRSPSASRDAVPERANPPVGSFSGD